MTGYGLAKYENDQYSLTVEVKSLNSKFLDIVSKLPKESSAYENELRKVISDKLVRGKINFNVELTAKSSLSQAANLNQEVFNHYVQEIKSASNGMGLTDGQVFQAVMTMPEVFEKQESDAFLVEKRIMIDLVDQATTACDVYRCDEGNSIHSALKSAGENIAVNLAKIQELDPARITHIKSRISENLAELKASEMVDQNRFEQELIYYIEKLDITEEYVRLENHIRFFLETLEDPSSQGKKLGFISQEMGREINTIGSKANDSGIQKLVVEMKDDLEKIKEQVLNAV